MWFPPTINSPWRNCALGLQTLVVIGEGSGHLVDLVPPGLLNKLDCMLRCEQKVWYWLYSDHRLEEIIWVCFRALPTLAL